MSLVCSEVPLNSGDEECTTTWTDDGDVIHFCKKTDGHESSHLCFCLDTNSDDDEDDSP